MALQDIQTYGKVETLIGAIDEMAVPGGGGSPKDIQNLGLAAATAFETGSPVAETGISEAAAAAMEAAAHLSTTDLAVVASALSHIASERTFQERAENEAARLRSLGNLRSITAHLEETHSAQDAEVAAARRYGATWTEIGQICGLNKTSALRRWGKREPAQPDDTGD